MSIGKQISFVAETVAKVASDAAGAVVAQVTQKQMSIDIDQAPKMIAGLEKAIEKLDGLYDTSAALRNLQSPGKDPYSGFATLAIRQSAGDDPGGYGWYNRETRKTYVKTIENVKAAIDSYRQTDDAARDGLTPKG